MSDGQRQFGQRLRLALLIGLHIIICCASLVSLADNYRPVIDAPTFHLFFDPSRLPVAMAVVVAFAGVATAFLFARFSFGYMTGFYFYTIMLGYLWLNWFTDLKYDHQLAGASAAASVIAYLVAALFVPLRLARPFTLSQRGFDRLLTCILLLAIVTVAIAAGYNFRLVALTDIYDFRDGLASPVLLNYLVAMVSSALLPFAFAAFVARRAYLQAGAVLVLLLLFYPITLSKLPLLAPFWLLAVLLLSKIAAGRVAVVLSLMLPMLAGLILHEIVPAASAVYFSTINFRLVAVPSIAMDIYHDYFSRHDFTHFCQISLVRRIMACPVQEPLWEIMEKTYKLGNLNASLFATEGIASVGPLWAPVSAFLCGLVVAFANRMSEGLPAGFILVSGAIIALVMLNVPLSIVLLSHGGAVLFLLWSVTPRDLFAVDRSAKLQAAR